MTGTKPSNKRILLLLPEVFGCAGGIQMFNRALCLAAGKWARRNNASVGALVLNDSEAPDTRYVNGGFQMFIGAGRSKARLVGSYLRAVASSRYDLIVYGHVSLAPLALVSAPLTHGAKTIVITYGVEVWRPLSLAQRRALSHADVVLAISDYTKNEVAKHGGIPLRKIRTFPCTLDPHWDTAAPLAVIEDSPPLILSVVRMGKEDRYKGVDSVLKSLPTVVQEFGPVEYRIVGEGDDVPRLKSLADKLGVASYVTFTGKLSEEELRDHYRRCSVFIMPSEKEGFGIVFLEAMAYGKPVVGGAHGGTPSVIKDGETGLLVKRLDTEGITQALLRLLRDGELRERVGRAGHERFLNEFTFEKFERNLDEIFGICLADNES